MELKIAERKSMVIVRIWEGLGNQMFQYAFARSLQAKGIEVSLDLDKAYDEMFVKYKDNAVRENSIQNFNISIPSIDVCKYKKYEYIYQDTILRKMQFFLGKHSLWKYRFYEEIKQGYSGKSARIKGNCYVKGWFQSERYFNSIRGILLKEFVPKEKITIPTELHSILKGSESVSIHVRRGDYVKANRAMNAAYYKKAIRLIKKSYKDPYFIVFSDDLAWTKENLILNERCIYVNENKALNDYEELFIMSRCKSNIISNSTFSWWAAWLNQNKEKNVIAPRSWLEGQKNIVPNGWIVL